MTHKRIAYSALALLAATISARGSSFDLVKEGQTTSCVVLPATAGPVEKHAASELARFLEKVTGAKTPVVDTPPHALYPIYLGTAEATSIPRSEAINKAVAQLTDDGFVLAADKDGVRVIAKRPLGVLYGAYGILKRQAGVRWFAPGAEFEHCPKRPSVSVPEQVTVNNPAFPFRQIFFYCAATNSKTLDTWDWFVRNGFAIKIHKNLCKLYGEELEKRGAEILQTRSFNDLLGNDTLFDAHPEYYGLFGGKRLKMEGEHRQPCTSHPNVAAIMADRVNKDLEVPPKGGGCVILNNDSTAWCQCENCVKLDPPEEKQKHFVGTRYFTMINRIAGEVYKAHPAADLWAIAYQNFLNPPTGVVPDHRLSIQLCLVGRCYRHSISDAKCPVNARFREILAGWKNLHPSNLTAYEYSWCENPSDVVAYNPYDRVFFKDLKYYHEIGLAGLKQTIAPPDGVFYPPWNTRWQKEAWHAQWQPLYLAAQVAWDINADYDVLAEDMGSNYYGKAWPAMKMYREELIRMYEERSDHLLGWGGTPYHLRGKCLEKPGVEARLLRLLDEAENLADSNPVVVKRVKRDRKYFGMCWQAVHREFMARKPQRELYVNKRVDPLVVDGELDEDDWKRADYIGDFIDTDGQTAATPRTFVRMLYDQDNVFLAVEAMESEPGRMKIKAKNQAGAVARDSSLEIFVVPFMGGKCAHIALNPRGIIRSALDAPGAKDTEMRFESGIEVKTRVLTERWVAEIRIPAAPHGRTINRGDAWKINVVRNRRLTRFWGFIDGESQSSSWSWGAVQGPESLRPVLMGTEPRTNGEMAGAALIKNGDFEDSAAPTKKTAGESAGSRGPSHWAIDPGSVTWVEGGAASGRKFLRIKANTSPSGQLMQGVNLPADFTGKVVMRAKVRGQGDLLGLGLKGNSTLKSQEWIPVEGTLHYGADRKCLFVLQVRNGQIDIDDVTVTQTQNLPSASPQ
ncbi:MAG: DUF4838 domain-containing protein [Kiritimatiellae bacterium]|nr:DUF4838 domain-containing protein [Kiritimatiellia bacterium]